MSLILRSLVRNPLQTRPLSRALWRLDDDLWHDDWPVAKVRRSLPSVYDSPSVLVDDMNRQMATAVKRMQEFAEDLDAIEDIVGRVDKETRPRAIKRRRRDDAVVQRTESGGLQLALDVSDYKPEDLKIKLVDDNLIVEATSELSGKDSYRRSHFKRWFKVPEECKVDDIRSRWTRDNRLLIDLPTNEPSESSKARTIPIEMHKSAEQIQDGAADQGSSENSAPGSK